RRPRRTARRASRGRATTLLCLTLSALLLILAGTGEAVRGGWDDDEGLVDGSAVGADRWLRRARDGARRRRRDASGGGGAAPGLPLAVGRVAALRGGAPLRRRERAHLPRTSPLLSVLRPRSPAGSPRARRASRLVQAPSPRRRLTRARSGPSPRWPSARRAG